MKKTVYPLFLFFLLLTANIAHSGEGLRIHHLQCEKATNPLAVDAVIPRFSWQITAAGRGVKQAAYQVLVASSPEKLARNEGDIWNSGKQPGDQSLLVAYNGKKLQSRQQCFWKVQVWLNKSEASWSEPATFQMGLLKPADWTAQWIGLDRAFPWDSVSMFARLSARYFRREAELVKPVKKATVYIAGLGLYEFYVNGQKVGDQVLAPAPTDYSKRVLYNSFDVTGLLQKGKNTLATVLSNGRFFAMRQNYKPHKWHTFGFPKMRLQLEVLYGDGTTQRIVSDESWKATADGPTRTANEYDGEEYDATKELTGWNQTGYNDRLWLKAENVKAPGGVLVAQANPPMKVMERIKPLSIRPSAPGKYILDMGQNMAGWLKLSAAGKRGDKITLRFAESLQPGGNLYLANLRDAKVTDSYTLKGGSKETWHPVFVYHGFRYVEVSGYPGVPTVDDFVGEVVYDNLSTSGTFETSNTVINQVYQNAYWGIRSNYKGMPVDCPQRNERQPWLGDRTVGAYGESFVFNNGPLYAKWLNDIEDAQTPEGSIPDVAPSFWYYYKDNMTWPGAFLTIADMLYRQTGDKDPVVRHYPAMKKWMAYMKARYRRDDFIMTKDSYGDWCVPPESPELIHSKDSLRNTDPKLIATAYYYYFLQLLQRFAVLSGNGNDVAAFQSEAAQVKQNFNRVFYNPRTAQYGNNAVTANLLPLAFDLAPEGDQQRVFQNMVEKILVENKGHISTGVIGTQWLMRWLTKFGRADIAYRLAGNTTYPSWGYMAKNGATTIWELWNGNTAAAAMNSQNHVMLLGDLLVWLYEDLAGIRSDETEVGFKKIRMNPSFVNGLDSVNASFESPYGTITSNWKKEAGDLLWQVNVPANTTAVLSIPASSASNVTEGGRPASSAEGVRFTGQQKGRVAFELGSGMYNFRSTSAGVVKN